MRRSDDGWRARVAEGLPPEIADDVPLDLFGLVTGLPAGTARIPWDGPDVWIIEHPARTPADPRLGGPAERGWEWVRDIHEGQTDGRALRDQAGGRQWRVIGRAAPRTPRAPA
jgi:hypothetical protein